MNKKKEPRGLFYMIADLDLALILNFVTEFQTIILNSSP
ncbi:hypothetical protein NVI2019_OHEONHNH_01474 [Providencia alcalifaciens]|nr:hypothetical protein NVI2019_OHEONHNH_01474 [Providencia alcalifaciens]CAG9420000.1 hypothetical protein NVI2019_PLFLNFOB_01847 [Providencia alcalifaciens]CAG9421054.1 hypothetical protein NVI2019_KOLGMIGM_01970 [Providencia alcalifaciens]CAG9421494.1 hypothetical protein NVI2019_NGLDDFDA_02010 [Providencia alcalifaciens]CAG9422046.1 hypothetical protein NVI2019_OGMBKCAO_01970 [Providencia alcalifaciens]